MTTPRTGRPPPSPARAADVGAGAGAVTDVSLAARMLEDGPLLARTVATALSRIGTRSLGVALLRRGAGDEDDIVFALAHDGALMQPGISVAEAKRARFVDPERVPLAQRDVWVDPVASGFVSAKASPSSLRVREVWRAFGVGRVLRRHVCLGPMLVATLLHGRSGPGARSEGRERRGAQATDVADRVALRSLEALARVFTPLLRAHALLAGAVAGAASPGQDGGPRPGDTHLTRRQRQIVDLVAQGFTNAQIAARLRLAPDTVKTTLHRLYVRHGARNRVGLVRALAGAPLL